MLINDKLESSFEKKTHHFKVLFVSKCTQLINSSVVLGSFESISTAIPSIPFTNEDILKIIESLNDNKVHGNNDFSIRMIKLCGESTVKPLSIIFQNCIDNGIHSDIWKKSNIIPVHKKVRNWSLIIIIIDQSLLYWIVRKSFKKLLLNSISKFLANNTFLSSYQSQLRPSDSYEYQLLSIVHVEVRGIFLHMPKAVNQTPIFKKIWSTTEMYWELPKKIDFKESFLNGQPSSWSLQMILLLFFSVAYDISLSLVQLNDDLIKMSTWAYQ